MERQSKSKHAPVTKFQDKFYHDYPSYRKEERREGRDGRAKTRRSDSGRSRNREARERPREKSSDRDQRPGARPAARSGSVKRFSSQPPERSGRSDVSNWTTQARGHWSRGQAEQTEDTSWRSGPGPGHPQVQDRRRWGWVGRDFEMGNSSNNNNNMSRSHNNNHNSIKSRHIANDYVDMSSMETSSTASDGSSMMTFTRPRARRSHDRDTDVSRSGSGYNKIYARHPGPVSRSRSISRPSPPRAKSVGYSSSSGHPTRTHSFTSIYETRSMGTQGYGGHSKGTSLDLRPLRTSLSSQGILFTETGHLPKQPSYEPDTGPMSISLQDLQSSGFRFCSQELKSMITCTPIFTGRTLTLGGVYWIFVT